MFLFLSITSFSKISYSIENSLVQYVDAKSLGLAGIGITPVSRATAITLNPANLYAFSGLGYDIDLGFLLNDVDIDFYKIDFESENSDFKHKQFSPIGSVSTVYEINSFMFFGFAFSITRSIQESLVVKEADLSNMDYNSIYQARDFSKLSSIALKRKNITESKKKDDAISKINRIPYIFLKYETYRFTPALSFSFSFFKVGVSLHLELNKFRGIHENLNSQFVFSMGTQIGLLFDIDIFKLGIYISSPIYGGNYSVNKSDLPNNLMIMANNNYEEDILYQKVFGTFLTAGIGFSVDIIPGWFTLLFDYRLDPTRALGSFDGGETDGTILINPKTDKRIVKTSVYYNRYILSVEGPMEYPVKESKDSKILEDSSSSEYKKYKHNFAVGINIENNIFPLSVQIGYNYTLDYDYSMIYPRHLISLGVMFKFLSVFYVRGGFSAGLLNVSNFEEYKEVFSQTIGINTPKVLKRSYRLMVGFGMKIF